MADVVEKEQITICLCQEKLKYNWIAYYHDGTHLAQYLEDGFENTFGDIDQEKLMFFALVDGEHFFGVDLEKGFFVIDGTILAFNLKENLSNYRLIYFRRNKVLVNSPNAEPVVIRYFFGWQANSDGDGKNVKKIMVVEPDDTVTVEE